MESKPGVANLLVKTDFDQAISPKLWLLSDFGFELSQLARIVTVVPKTLINVSLGIQIDPFSYLLMKYPRV